MRGRVWRLRLHPPGPGEDCCPMPFANRPFCRPPVPSLLSLPLFRRKKTGFQYGPGDNATGPPVHSNKMKSKVSDLIVRFFEEKGVRQAFGIIGSANSHIFDSAFHGSEIEIICNHHEQACVMAAQAYWKISRIPTFALVTAGAGSSNAITGVLSAWADSIPCIVISGQEKARYFTPDHAQRMFGIQGYDSPFAVSKMTKYGARVLDPTRVLYELEKAWHLATTGRPGPCWLDFPMDVQGALVDTSTLLHFTPEDDAPGLASLPMQSRELEDAVGGVLALLRQAKRPLLWLGVGVRIAGAQTELDSLVQAMGVPVLLSWSAVDLLPSDSTLVVGSAGLYGQRAANLILQSCDYLLAIGTRLAIPQVGYDITELARDAKTVTVVDIDPVELAKYPTRCNQTFCADAGDWLAEMHEQITSPDPVVPCAEWGEWVDWCQGVKSRFPRVGPEHEDQDGFLNSYKFMDRLAPYLKPDQIVVTDMGTALLSGHQALPITPPQRMLTSQGLGEMGFGLPGAIGASIAKGRGEVLCLNCDGGMMMNLQELQTVVHYCLPIKIIIFNNDGYLMIKHTQKAILGGRYSGTDARTGVSCPDYGKLALAFGIDAFKVRTWEDFDAQIPVFLNAGGPAICEVFMHPEQFFHPKLSVATRPDGTLVSPPLEDLSPLLGREVLAANLKVNLHEKSLGLLDTLR
jgi:acetolactate synthase-1/2/3 large subunit